MLVKSWAAAVISLSVSASPLVQIVKRDFNNEHVLDHAEIMKRAHNSELRPRHHPDHDAYDHAHLCPEMSHRLFYSAHDSAEVILPSDRYVSSHMQYKYPTVVLDHSNHVETSFLAKHMVTVDFSGESAFQTAKASWTTTGVPFMLITSTDSHDDHYRHLLVSSFACSESMISCTLNVTESDTEDVLNEFMADFGHYDDLMKRAEAPWSPGHTDLALDKELGYYSFDQANFDTTLDTFVEGVEDHDYNHYNDWSVDDDGIFDDDGLLDIILLELYQEELAALGKAEATRRMVQRRKGNNQSKAPQVQRKGQQAGKKNVFQHVAGAVKKVVTAPVKFVKKVAEVVTGTPQSLSFANKGKFPKDLPPPHTDSPFVDKDGKKYSTFLIWEGEKTKGKAKASATVYCLSCQLGLEYKIGGQLGYNLLKLKTTAASVEFKGDLDLALRMGLVAEVKVEKEAKKVFSTIPLQPYSIPNVIAIGPFVELAGKVTVGLGMSGQVIAGGTIKTGIDYKMDFLDPDNKKKSRAVVRKPEIKPEFNASAEVSASLKLSLPVGLYFGVSVLNGKALDIKAGMTSEPGIEAKASIGAKYSAKEGANVDCKGVKVELNGVHQLYFQAVAGVAAKISAETTKYDIADPFSHTFKEHCFEFKKGKRNEDNSTTGGYLEPFEYQMEALDAVSALDFVAGPPGTDTPGPAIAASLDTFATAPDSAFSAKLDSTKPEEPAFNYTIVSSMDASWDLYGTQEGNLGFTNGENLVSAQDLFSVYDSWVLGDAKGRLLVYFSQEMTKYGVSRIRLEDQERIPKTSRMVGLVPVTVSDIAPDGLPPAVLIAADSKGRVFLPVACNYKDGQATKIFLVEDLDKGIATLESSDTDKMVTSGAIDECDFVALTNGFPGIA